jgi:hypothetical protein
MKFVSRLILTTAIATGTTIASAESMKCTGMNDSGKTVHVLVDWDTETLNVDGDIMKIVAGTQGENGVATENFKTEDGTLVYNSITVNGKQITINQYDAKTDEFIASVKLACKNQ